MPDEPAKIAFDGKTYASVDAMPPAVRRSYEDVARHMADRNDDGVPDLFEGINPQFDEQMRKAYAELKARGEAPPNRWNAAADAAIVREAQRQAAAGPRGPDRPASWLVRLLVLAGIIVVLFALWQRVKGN